MKLHTNQQIVVDELLARGATIRMIDHFDELLEVNYEGKVDFLLDRFSSKAPYHSVRVTADKYLTKRLLQEKSIAVPTGQVFCGNSINEIVSYAKQFNSVVLKPNWGSHGDHVQVDVAPEEVPLAVSHFVAQRGSNEPFIIEEFLALNEHRLFITAKGDFACIHREPAHVLGDGLSSIQELIEKENAHRTELKKNGRTSICPLAIDDESRRFLLKIGLTLDSVPPKSTKVFLRHQSNLSKGGLAIDLTDKVHASVIDLAKTVLRCFPGLPCAGLDFLCEDISKPIAHSRGAIIEVNSNPGLAMHLYPAQGKPQPVGKYMVDVMFSTS